MDVRRPQAGIIPLSLAEPGAVCAWNQGYGHLGSRPGAGGGMESHRKEELPYEDGQKWLGHSGWGKKSVADMALKKSQWPRVRLRL